MGSHFDRVLTRPGFGGERKKETLESTYYIVNSRAGREPSPVALKDADGGEELSKCNHRVGQRPQTDPLNLQLTKGLPGGGHGWSTARF